MLRNRDDAPSTHPVPGRESSATGPEHPPPNRSAIRPASFSAPPQGGAPTTGGAAPSPPQPCRITRPLALPRTQRFGDRKWSSPWGPPPIDSRRRKCSGASYRVRTRGCLDIPRTEIGGPVSDHRVAEELARAPSERPSQSAFHSRGGRKSPVMIELGKYLVLGSGDSFVGKSEWSTNYGRMRC
jgi:hypothetical protein